jgi:hypothetical protein
MGTNDSISAENLDPRGTEFGIRDANGHWRPPYPCRYAPLFAWPIRPLMLLRWLFGYPGFLWPINTFFIGLALLTWYVLQPSLAQVVHLRPGWIALMFLRNMALLWLVSGSLHLVLYTLKLQGDRRKYHPQWQTVNSKKYLFANQVFDNVLRSSPSGAPSGPHTRCCTSEARPITGGRISARHNIRSGSSRCSSSFRCGGRRTSTSSID